MQLLDSDNALLVSHSGQQAERGMYFTIVAKPDCTNFLILTCNLTDMFTFLSYLFSYVDICQFVPFRDYENAPPERFGAAVLAEVPGNIVEYFISREPSIQPGQKPGLSAVSY